MRIKRQRRKLRGKYSGNCLSCAAKWSKCWYIASVDNQREWETRLSKTVTPGDDEVCFQCWDAKIRTSPKRKIHFKTELSELHATASSLNISTESTPSGTRYAKRVDRNKRRALSGDIDYIHTAEFSTLQPRGGAARSNFGALETSDLYDEEEDDSFEEEENDCRETSIYSESVIFDEENAVILLSTAFRTIPFDVNININFNSFHDDEDDEDEKAKKRGAYYCGKCGKLKKGHVCDDVTTPKSEEDLSPVTDESPLPSISIQLSTLEIPLQSSGNNGPFAQPVVS